MVMALRDDGTSVRALWRGRELFRYVYRPGDPAAESPRPYFHPVRTLAGDLVTGCRPDDHPWHKGIAWSLPDVGGENFWGGPSYRRGQGYVQLDNNGTVRHEAFAAARAGDGTACLEERLSWVTAAGRTWFAERRRIAVAAWPEASAWSCAFETRMENVSGQPVSFGSPGTEGGDNAGYGGLFWRGPRSFTGGQVLTCDGEGGDELMGWRGPWLAFRAPGPPPATLVFGDWAANPGHPGQWFVRSTPFACVCPAPFFAAERPVPAGSALALRYHVVIADGTPDPAGCARLIARAGGEEGQT